MEPNNDDIGVVSQIALIDDKAKIAGLLSNYAHQTPENRLQLTLQELFKQSVGTLHIDNMSKEAELIHRIYPRERLEDIKTLLESIGNEENRLRIVVKILLHKNGSFSHKRSNTTELPADVVEKKKIRIADHDANPIEGLNLASPPCINQAKEMKENSSDDNPKPSSSFDSQSTLIYSFENQSDDQLPLEGGRKEISIKYSDNMDNYLNTAKEGAFENSNQNWVWRSKKTTVLSKTEERFPSLPVNLEESNASCQIETEETPAEEESNQQPLPSTSKEFTLIKAPKFLLSSWEKSNESCTVTEEKPAAEKDNQDLIPSARNELQLIKPAKFLLTSEKSNAVEDSFTAEKGNRDFSPWTGRNMPVKVAEFPLPITLPCEIVKEQPPAEGKGNQDLIPLTRNELKFNKAPKFLLNSEKSNPSHTVIAENANQYSIPSTSKESVHAKALTFLLCSTIKFKPSCTVITEELPTAEKGNQGLIPSTMNELKFITAPKFLLNSEKSNPSHTVIAENANQHSIPSTSKESVHAKALTFSLHSRIKSNPSWTCTSEKPPAVEKGNQYLIPSTSNESMGVKDLKFPHLRWKKSNPTCTIVEETLSATEKEYDLHEHLMEIYNCSSRTEIEAACQKFNADQYERPNNAVFEDITSELTARQSTRFLQEVADAQSTMALDKRLPDHDANVKQPDSEVKKVFEETPSTSGVMAAFIKDKNYVLEAMDDIIEEEEEEEEVETENSEELRNVDNKFVYPLMEMFPEACPKFIRKLCLGKIYSPAELDSLISTILDLPDYPRRQKFSSPQHCLNIDQQLELLKDILPNADPSYLQARCLRFLNDSEAMKVFVTESLEKHNYPTLQDYKRRQQLSAQQKQYTTEFKVENFLSIIPNPQTYFKTKQSKSSRSVTNVTTQHYTLSFLRNHFSRIHLRQIREYYKQRDHSLLETVKALKALEKSQAFEGLRSKRAFCPLPEAIQDIPLLQEIAYVEHEAEIREHLKLQQKREKEEEEHARLNGLMQTCCCCYDDDVMPKLVFSCEKGCVFCKECVRRGAEVAFGDGKLDFCCLSNCDSHFSLQTLQAVLNPKMFSNIAQKKQIEEVKTAGLEDLESCPFCDFATIPAAGDKLFRCMNPDCMKESCRNCKEPSHIPLSCDEVEKDSEVKIRTFIENKMTEALLRKCYKCGLKFIKADGCNKMTCSCGAFMCYVCGKPVTDYKHFNGPGGDRLDLCPLYSDTNRLHEQAVLQGATEAKREVGVDADPTKLKHDPAMDAKSYYDNVARTHPINVPGAVHVHMPVQNLDEIRRLQRHRELMNQYGGHRHHRRHRHRHRGDPPP